MVRSSISTVLLSLAALTLAQSANKAAVCGPDAGGKLCPSDSPCCSTYGQCGTGAYCLGGCDPRGSVKGACMPAPICQSQDYKMDTLDDVAPNTKYLGDASKANWVSSGTPVIYNNGLLLTMAPSTVGTLLTSTHYVWYGKVSGTFSTSQGQGVVTAFILMSDVHDEIDFEFVGTDVNSAQSNFYWQGVTDYNNMKPLNVSFNTAQQTHTYEIDWQPDTLTWSIDGNVMRTLKRSDTYNTTDKQFHYPQTPARVQLSLWPAGLPTNGEGTIAWAGGLVNWDSPYMQNGYYYSMFTDVNVECYDPPSGYQNNGNKAYEYTGLPGTQNQVETTNDNTILGSFEADGTDQKKGAQASGTSSSSSQATSAAANQVPGMSGAGTASTGDAPVANAADQGSSGSGSSSSGGSSGFSQGSEQSTGGASSQRVAGSLVALVSVCVAAMML